MNNPNLTIFLNLSIPFNTLTEANKKGRALRELNKREKKKIKKILKKEVDSFDIN